MNYRIENGYVTLKENVLLSSEDQQILDNQSTQNVSKIRQGFVKCKEGFILDNPNKTELFCYNGLWGFQTQDFGMNGYERKTVNRGLPKCRNIVCKPNPFIPNGRLLKQVGL